MIKRYMNRALSIVLSLTMAATVLSGCNKHVTEDNTVSSADKDKIVEETTKAILEDMDNSQAASEQASIEEVIDTSMSVGLSTNWEDYVGDFETFVYGLLANELKYKYDVFPAYTKLKSGLSIHGMAYTDYSECYTNSDETRVVFNSGFIPYYGEIEIPDEEFDEGLELFDCDYQDDTTSFLLAYEGSKVLEHCVVYGKYLKYGLDDKGHVYYETMEYDEDNCDVSLGSLYSYDEKKYLYDTDFGTYKPLSGTPLSQEIDYAELEKAINDVLEKQDFNFASVDIQTYVHFSQEAIESYLLSLQEEKFLGYDVDYLAKLTSQINLKECYRITADGLMFVNADGKPINDADSLAKWLVKVGCVITIATGIVGSMVCMECPPLSAAAGAMAGTGIEVLMQVALSGKPLDSIDWGKVVLAAATGAVSGYLGPYINAQYKGAAHFLIDSLLDGLLGGAEKSIAAWLDNENGEKIIKEFGYGVALGFGISAFFKAAGLGLGKVVKNAASGAEILTDKLFPNLVIKTPKVLQTVGNAINDALTGLKEVADDSVFHSEYISRKLSWKQLELFLNENTDELANLSLKNLTRTKEIVDLDGNVISKETLKELFENAADGDVIGRIKIDDDVIDVVKKNNIVSIMFDESKYQTVTLTNRLTPNRTDNFDDAAEKFKDSWIKDPSKIPESIKKILSDNNKKLEDLSNRELANIIQSSDMVMHENPDLMTITLVSRKLHDASEGGISHYGGVALAGYIKSHMGTSFFDEILAAIS
ncbi:hypothetical protein [Butyrivibrio sp. MC2021]|uniref:hypothetical protein n=1 Tax=Butyrivibrio sp. MC2021 TaxID=1408306 RepID=UPI00047B95FA|nr:hypothetical protein [Butyrivibrio sp. MC2021]